MTPEEKLADLEAWLLEQYNSTFEVWQYEQSTVMRGLLYNRMLTIAAVARRLFADGDDVPPIFDERYVVFTRHLDFNERVG